MTLARTRAPRVTWAEVFKQRPSPLKMLTDAGLPLGLMATGLVATTVWMPELLPRTSDVRLAHGVALGLSALYAVVRHYTRARNDLRRQTIDFEASLSRCAKALDSAGRAPPAKLSD